MRGIGSGDAARVRKDVMDGTLLYHEKQARTMAFLILLLAAQ